MTTERFSDGGPHEPIAGYSRAVRRGGRIMVSGTTARGEAAEGDTYTQARDCLERVLAAVLALGGRREDVLRTRVYLAPAADWALASRAHAELLGDVAPANTMLSVAGLIGDGLLVEIEADAEVGAETGGEADAGGGAAARGGVEGDRP
ncbi:MAG TPA: Rid family hydrolase [Acidimicrobiales bacterium]|nr:Rid family hydrolase [Acidimicrobiales bacterium]